MRGSENLDLNYDDSINRNVLKDVYGISDSIDFRSPPSKRMKSLLPNITSVNKYVMEGYQVEIIWDNSEKTLQKLLEGVITDN